MIAFNVFLNGKEIDTVFYSDSANVDCDEVRSSLINHDGYDSGIEVVLEGAEVPAEDSDMFDDLNEFEEGEDED